MKLSVVATLYRSQSTLPEFYRRASAAALAVTSDYEIILVNDGSPDDSLAQAKTLAQQDPHVVVVDLSRNFGHHKAMMTGLAHTQGDYVFLLDSDLEEPPELLAAFWNDLQAEDGLDVIYGVQRSRKGGVVERLSGVYYDIFNLLSAVKVEKNVSVIRLMTRRYVNSLLQHREAEPIFIGLAALTGYRQRSYSFDKTSKGESSYSFARKLDMLANSIASFSNRPLTLIFYLGLFMTASAMLAVMFFVGAHFMHDTVVSGWTSLIVSLWLLGGIIVLSLGVIGIYLAKIFNEVKNRPYTVVRDIYRGDT